MAAAALIGYAVTVQAGVYSPSSSLSRSSGPEETSLTRLVRGAVRNLDAPSVEVRKASLAVLAAALGPEGSQDPALEAALEESGALARLSQLATATDPGLHEVATYVLTQTKVQLGLDQIDSAVAIGNKEDASGDIFAPLSPNADPDSRSTRLTASPSDGNHTPGAVRWFRFDAAPGREYEVSLIGCRGISIGVFADDQASLIKRGTPTPLTPLTFVTDTGAPHYLRVRTPSSAYCTRTAALRLVNRQAPKHVALGDSPTTAVTIQPGRDTYYSELSAGRPGWLRFNTRSGVLYRIETLRLAPGIDTILSVFDSAGSMRIERDDDSGTGFRSSRIDWLSAEDGSATLKLEDNDEREGGFHLQLRELWHGEASPLAAPAGLTDAPPVLTPGQPIAVRFGEDDRHARFLVELRAGDVAVASSNAPIAVTNPQGGGIFPVLEHDGSQPSGTLTDSQATFNEKTWQALEAGPYVISLDRDTSGTAIVSVRVVSSELASPKRVKFGATAAAAPTVPSDSDGRVRGLLGPKATGYIAIPHAGSQSLTVRVVALGSGADIDASILQGDTPRTLKEAEDSESARISTAGATRQRAASADDDIGYGSSERSVGTIWAGSETDRTSYVRLTSKSKKPSEVALLITLTPSYDGFHRGDRVILGKHEEIAGSKNWSGSMAAYVGREATITSLAGRDPSGSFVVNVDVDDGTFVWRTRNFSRPVGPPAPAQQAAQ